ncbi:hypothetical protein K3495_g10873 [Podosphaera aphanis]|nr:hypothetical protein K3495_g10873 [Podosphaera aphanis]
MMTTATNYTAPQLNLRKHSGKGIGGKSGGGSPRKTLTDNDRRLMCEYHEKNPNIKQTEIGALFGVERSTVSKVLRQREKYLCREESISSPVKRVKGKFPDIDRAITVWVHNLQKDGAPPTDAQIQEKMLSFTRTTRDKDNYRSTDCARWLEKFKQKNGVGEEKPERRSSEPNTAKEESSPQEVCSTSLPNAIEYLPISPRTLFSSASPVVAEEERENGSEYCSDYMETLATDSMSPTTPFPFSPSGESNMINSRQPTINSCCSPLRTRSQTSPILATDSLYLSTHNFQCPSVSHESSPLLENPIEDETSPYSINSVISSSIPILPGSCGSPMVSDHSEMQVSHHLPTDEDARGALETLIAYLTQSTNVGLLDQQEYLTVVKLYEKIHFRPQHLHHAFKADFGGMVKENSKGSPQDS